MATYIISFRIASGNDYSDRYTSVVEAIRREASEGTTWEETTSLVVLKSDKSPDTLASTIYLGSKFNVSRDTLLVVNSSNATYATRGEVKYPATLASLFTSNPLVNSLFA